MTAVPTDEIYERYLQKAISEINDLWHELGELSDALHVPVLGSGHALADVFLLKFTPQQSEIQEGIAFFGRAGQALLKSFGSVKKLRAATAEEIATVPGIGAATAQSIVEALATGEQAPAINTATGEILEDS